MGDKSSQNINRLRFPDLQLNVLFNTKDCQNGRQQVSGCVLINLTPSTSQIVGYFFRGQRINSLVCNSISTISGQTKSANDTEDFLSVCYAAADCDSFKMKNLILLEGFLCKFKKNLSGSLSHRLKISSSRDWLIPVKNELSQSLFCYLFSFFYVWSLTDLAVMVINNAAFSDLLHIKTFFGNVLVEYRYWWSCACNFDSLSFISDKEQGKHHVISDINL